MSISPALKALTAYRQFIVYRLELSKTRPGKLDKLPIDPNTGTVANAQDPANWLDFDSASRRARELGAGFAVGFVLTRETKLFCLDMDNCVQPDGQLTPTANEVLTMFPDAAVERSVSGTGLHIWGAYTDETPLHGCKNIALGLELYTENRFIALGDPESAIGNAATDCKVGLQCAAALYFQPDAATVGAKEWTDGPVEEWRGPADDDELIQRALRSKQSAASAFGNRASFADLWNNNGAALMHAYPAEGRMYDASSADAALAQHLAFWTGNDCERIERIMWKSALVRDKWTDHKDYLRRTILGSVARQDEVYVDESTRRQEQIAEAMRIGEGSDVIRIAGTMTLDEMLPRFVFIQDGQQVVDLQRPQHVVALADWKATFKASTTTLEVKGQYNFDGTPKTKNYETSALWEKSPKRQISDAVTFKAGGKRVTRDPNGREALNTWSPIERNMQPGDASLFVEHVGYLFGEDAPRFLDWLAHIEQRPGELPHHGWVHISDAHGTGRNWLAGVIARLWEGHAAVNFDLSGMLRTGFNDRLSRKLIAVVDEIREGGNDAKWDNAETMKRVVTEEYRTINPKFGRIREEFNACRWLIFSNHVSALTLDEHDRRFNVVHNEATPRGSEYYARLYAALKDPAFIAGVAQMLKHRDLSNFNPGAHAVMNKAKESLVSASRSEADETLIELVKHWPTDIIHASTLGELITGQVGGKVTRSHIHALERRGIKPYKSLVRLNGAPARVTVLRNVAKWMDASPDQIRAELGRAMAAIPFGGARVYLDNLTAA